MLRSLVNRQVCRANLLIVCRFSFHSETAKCNCFQKLMFLQLLHFKESFDTPTLCIGVWSLSTFRAMQVSLLYQ